jgi:hypothetical protein
MRRFSNSNSLIDYAESKKITGCLRLKREAFYWYKEGKLHRIDGPAIEYRNGTKFWYLKGLMHRIDGPACEYSDGRIAWHIEGEEFCATKLFSLIKNSIFLEKKQSGKYNLDWLLFLTDKGFEEFPIISEMESNVCFKIALSQIRIK